MVQNYISQYIKTFENSEFGISIFDLNAECITQNPKALFYQKCIMGPTLDLNTSILEFTSHKNINRFKDYLNRSINGETQMNIRKFNCYDGKVKWLLSEINPFYFNNKIVGCMVITNDISELHHLKAFKAISTQIFENMTQKICLFNEKGHYLWCNQKSCVNHGKKDASLDHCIYHLSLNQKNPLQIEEVIRNLDTKFDAPVFGLSKRAPFESGSFTMHAINSHAYGDVYVGIFEANKQPDDSDISASSQLSRNKQENYIVKNFENDLFRHKFHLLFQPIINTDTNTCEGYEALTRWQPNGKKSISPDVFIPILEKDGTISQLTRWVFNECNNLIEKHFDHFEERYMSINISVLDLMNDLFMEHIDLIYACKPWLLKKYEFELTESYYIDNYTVLNKKINHLKKYGIKIAIDDFGTGFSTLEKIVQMPFDRLKIDRNFVNRLPTSRVDRIVLNNICSLAKELNIKITVEGVETYDQMLALYNMRITTMQGFYFDKPAEFETFITNKS